MRIHNGDTAIVTFTGVGYDKRVMGDTMQLTADQLETSSVPSKFQELVHNSPSFLVLEYNLVRNDMHH